MKVNNFGWRYKLYTKVFKSQIGWEEIDKDKKETNQKK